MTESRSRSRSSPVEAYRSAWPTPPKILARARALATHRDDHALLSLPVLALLIGVHVKTLRSAARDGRLPVIYDTRTTFRRLRVRATPAAARTFRRSYYGRTVRPDDRRAPLTWTSVPADYDVQIRAVRRARGLSQAQLATLVGAECCFTNGRYWVVHRLSAGQGSEVVLGCEILNRMTALGRPVSYRIGR